MDVGTHILRNGPQRQLHMLFGRFYGDAQPVCDLFVLEVLVPAEEINFLLLRRQLRDGHVYKFPVVFSLCCRLFIHRFLELAGPAQLAYPFVGGLPETVEGMVPAKDK